MKIKMISLQRDNEDNAATCLLKDLANELSKDEFSEIRSLSFNRKDIASVSIKTHGFSEYHPLKVSILECETCGVYVSKDLSSFLLPNCSCMLNWTPKTYSPMGDPYLMAIYSNQKCLYDDYDVDVDKEGIAKLPLEYFFAKDFLAKWHVKRDMCPELGIKIDEKYDLNNYEVKHGN